MSTYVYRRGSIFWALTLIGVGVIFIRGPDGLLHHPVNRGLVGATHLHITTTVHDQDVRLGMGLMRESLRVGIRVHEQACKALVVHIHAH